MYRESYGPYVNPTTGRILIHPVTKQVVTKEEGDCHIHMAEF